MTLKGVNTSAKSLLPRDANTMSFQKRRHIQLNDYILHKKNKKYFFKPTVFVIYKALLSGEVLLEIYNSFFNL